MSAARAEAQQRLRGAVEELAANAMQADGHDLPELADLHRQCEDAQAAASLAGLRRAAGLATQAGDLCEQVVLLDGADPAALIAQLGTVLTELQTALDDEPEEVAADDAPAAAKPDAPVAAPAAESSPTAREPVSLAGNESLVAEFLSEAAEHVATIELNLLTLERQPDDGEALNAVFRGFHTIKGVAGFLALGDIGGLSHEAESLLDKARKGALLLAGFALDAVFDASRVLRELLELVGEALENHTPVPPRDDLGEMLARLRVLTAAEPETKLGELMVASRLAPVEAVETALAAQAAETRPRPLGEHLVTDGQVPARSVAAALRAQEMTRAAAGVPGAGPVEQVKVDAPRLDKLLDTIGELVVATSMVRQAASTGAGGAQAQVNHLEKITRELHDLGTSLRMVPIQPLFQRLSLLVRDLAKKSGKTVALVTSGADTELDKTVIDRIGDPLLHMIRNSVDHGLESPEERAGAGKPATGRIELRAFHQGGQVHVEIEDDGRGLDVAAILAKARGRGLVREGEVLSDEAAWQLIFEPGFSTASVVTDISGRGVGMDVVKRSVEGLRGSVDVSSRPGQGTCFSIRLPLTLAIIDGMSVRVGGELFIVPTPTIVTSLRPTPDALTTVLGRGEMLRLQGRLLPLFRLGELFGVKAPIAEATEALAVVVEDNHQQAALLVDELLGQQQIVIKSLGDLLQGAVGIAGGAVMGNGRVGLIVDIAGLLRLASTTGEPGAASLADVA